MPRSKSKFITVSGVVVKTDLIDPVHLNESLLQIGPSFKIGSRYFCVTECRCGVIICPEVRFASSGRIVSCGCERVKHGCSDPSHRTDEYRIWVTMKQRCSNPRANGYKNYGGAGVCVYDEWNRSFESFLNDMGHRPSKKHTIDRIDVNKGYSPDNCRWVTWDVQSRNKRSNFNITAFGETKCISDWVRDPRSGIRSIGALKWRLRKGMAAEEAISKPNHCPVKNLRNHENVPYVESKSSDLEVA